MFYNFNMFVPLCLLCIIASFVKKETVSNFDIHQELSADYDLESTHP